MNGVKTETHVRVEQTARGIWYCSGVDVYGDGLFSLKFDLSETMKTVEEVLKEHNTQLYAENTRINLPSDETAVNKSKKVKL